MKKIMSFAAMLLVTLVTTFTFTSCEDQEIAYDLEGCWKGEMKIKTKWDSRYYESTYTEIEFYRRSSTGGDGYWIDHYSGAPRDYVANHITWSVSGGSIHVTFREERADIWIDDYTLTNNRFDGYIRDGDARVKFYMNRVSSRYWNDYDWGYDYWYDSKSGAAFDSRSVSGDAPEMIARPKRVVGVE